MSLRSQIVQAPFRLGLSEGQDPAQAPVGTLKRAVNVRWLKTNRLEKRLGTDDLPDPGVAAAYRLFTRGDELGLIGDLQVLTFSPVENAWNTPEASGALPDVGLTWDPLLDPTLGVMMSEMVHLSNGEIWHAWVSGDPTVSTAGVLYYQVLDAQSGGVITPPTTLATSVTHLRVLAFNGVTPIILWVTGANIKSHISSTTSTLRTDFAGTAFDACMISGTFVIAYSRATDIYLYSYDLGSPPAQQATSNIGDATQCDAVSIDGSVNDLIFIGYWKTTPAFRFCTHHPTTLAQVLAPVNVDTTAAVALPQLGVLRTSATTCIYSYSCHGTAASAAYGDGLFASYVVDSAGTATIARKTYGKRALSRPFALNSKYYAFIADFINAASVSGFATSAPFADGYLVQVPTTGASPGTPYEMHRYVGRTHVLTAGNWLSRWTGNVTTGTSSDILFGVPFQSASTATYTGIRQGIHLFRAWPTAYRPDDMWRPVNVNQETYFAAGVLTGFDGRLAFDYGMGAPAYSAQTAASNSTGVLLNGTYLYSAVTEWRSHAGVLHRGPAAITVSMAVTGANDTVTIYMLHPELSLRINNASTGTLPSVTPVYRSVANGTALQRLTVDPSYNFQNAQGGGSDAALFLVDAVADANIGGSITLASRPLLYTASVLDDYQPPACVTLFYHADRLWALAGDERTWWYSKTFQDDFGVAPGFHPNFRIVFPEKMIAGASMDEKGIFFSEKSIWYLTGSGPAPNGENSDFGLPQGIQTDSGCTNARSIVSMPDGIMFEGTGDIFLLTRGLEVQWIGRAVQDQLLAYPNITSAVLLSKRNEVRFTANAADGESGIVLVYNYVEQQWSTFVYHDTLADLASTPIADALLWGGLYTFVTPAGNVFQEDEETHLDGGTEWVAIDVESAEVFAEGPLSYQRVRRAYFTGKQETQCGVRVRVATNGSDTYDSDDSWDSAEMAAVASAKVGTHIKRQTCGSIRVRITDAPPTALGYATVGTGKGITLSAMGFEIAPKRGIEKRQAEAKK